MRDLRKLEFQVAEKTVARVLVELHNAGLFESGLVLVGTLCYMAWLNELGAKAVIARTQDIDLARSRVPPTSFKRPGAKELRIDVLTDGPTLGRTVPIPELQWHAQTVPFYDYLLSEPREACALAGGHLLEARPEASEQLEIALKDS